MNAVIPRSDASPGHSRDSKPPRSHRTEDYPAWREGLLVGAALLALALLQYWHLAFH